MLQLMQAGASLRKGSCNKKTLKHHDSHGDSDDGGIDSQQREDWYVVGTEEDCKTIMFVNPDGHCAVH